MKKIYILPIILIIIAFSIAYISNSNGLIKLSYYLKNTGAKIERINIEGYGKFYSNENLNTIALKIYRSSQIQGKYNIYQGDMETTIYSNNITIKVKKISKENLNYASFLLSQHTSYKNIDNIRNSIYKGFSIYRVKPTFSFLIEGEYPGKMEVSEMKDRASRILSYMGASDIKGINDRNLVSFSGFTPMIREKLKVIDYYINLNIALRNDKKNCNTHIWIGSPIIASEY